MDGALVEKLVGKAELRVLDAARFMDANECSTIIPAACNSAGRSTDEILANIEAAIGQFSTNVKARFKLSGEW